MNPDRFARLKKLLLAAFDLPKEQRKAYLDQACGDDPELRSEAKAILADGGDPSALLQQAGDMPATAVDPDAVIPSFPTNIAGYCIKRILGQGGMGVVYEALQEKPRRTVALKVMRSGIASKSALRRFEYESQLLARLTHPGIAQVYEAGTHDDGMGPVPYFAMEYVPDAKSIIEYAEEKQLGTRDRMELFTQVCDAVHHGHQKGIIHRDLKPGNILVNPDGRVKVIDFGVARSTDSDMALTTLQTDVGQLIGTLQYMSPEQCAADPNDIDTRSDVYALGVVQYELLCGQLPYDVRKKAFHEVTRVIREEQPTRPSSISKQLRGDVETITLKALEKERDRRYQSAVELSQDIRRYLSGEAIIGRPPSFLYQLQIFARRHKAIFAAVATILVVLAVGLVVSTGMYFRAEQAREETANERDRALAAEQEAEKRRAEAEAVTTFLSETLSAVDPAEAQGKEVTIREMLDKASEKIDESFEDQPLVDAALRTTIGNTYRALGQYAIAEPHLEKALEIRRQELGEEHPDTLECMEGLAWAYAGQGRFDEANPLQIQALEYRRRVLGEEHPDTLLSMNNMGDLYYEQGRIDEALPYWSTALEMRRRILGKEHPDTLWSMNGLAAGYSDNRRYKDAEPLLLEILEIQRHVLGEKHPETLISMFNLARLFMGQNRNDEAMTLYRQTHDLMLRVLGEEHPDTLQGMNNLANFHSSLGQHEEAVQLAEQAVEIGRRALGEQSNLTLRAKANLAKIYFRQGRHDKAITLSQQTLELRQQVLGEAHPYTLSSMYDLAWIYGQTGRYDKAVSLAEKALEYRRSTFGEEHPKTCGAIQILAWCYGQWGRREKAASLYKENLELQLRVLGEEHTDTLSTMNNLAFYYCELGRLDKAEPLFERTLEIRQRVLGEEHQSTIIAAYNLASRIYRDQGRFDEARPLFKKTLETARKSLPDGHTDTGIILSNYGSCLILMGRYGEAESMLLEAFNVLSTAQEVPKMNFSNAIERLATLYDRWGKPDKAAEWRAKLPAEELQPTPD